FDERLRHPVGLGRVGRGGADHQLQRPRELTSVTRGVTGAVVGQPLDRMRCAKHGGAEAMLEGLAHQVAHHLARYSAAGCQPPHHLAVATIETEEHLDRFAVPAADGKHVRAPAQIALKRCHHPVVAALAPAVIARQQQLINPHDPVGPFVVGPRATLRLELAIEQRGNPPISITGALRDNRAHHRHQPFVICSRAAWPRNGGLKCPPRVERATPSPSATPFTWNPPVRASSSATAVFLSGSAPGLLSGSPPPASSCPATAPARGPAPAAAWPLIAAPPAHPRPGSRAH